jgi:hypothetical protein
MFDILRDRTYRHLFLAQVVVRLGTGLAVVALSLLAYDLAGNSAAMVLALSSRSRWWPVSAFSAYIRSLILMRRRASVFALKGRFVRSEKTGAYFLMGS